jgi:hypothetical protein
MISFALVPHQLRQFGDVCRNSPGLVFAEQLRRRSPAGIFSDALKKKPRSVCPQFARLFLPHLLLHGVESKPPCKERTRCGFWSAPSFTTKQASNSSTDQGGGKR